MVSAQRGTKKYTLGGAHFYVKMMTQIPFSLKDNIQYDILFLYGSP
jgi:hypothetical protein